MIAAVVTALAAAVGLRPFKTDGGAPSFPSRTKNRLDGGRVADAPAASSLPRKKTVHDELIH